MIVMDRDMNSLNILRYSMNKEIQPVEFRDEKMRNILLGLPYYNQKVIVEKMQGGGELEFLQSHTHTQNPIIEYTRLEARNLVFFLFFTHKRSTKEIT